MRKIILGSHGDFAKGAMSSVRMIVGEAQPVELYGMYPGDSASDYAHQLEQEITAETDTEFIIVSDLYGASVCSAFYPLLRFPNVRLFAGFNLCFLLELLQGYPDTLTDEDAEELAATARTGIRVVHYRRETPKQTIEEDF